MYTYVGLHLLLLLANLCEVVCWIEARPDRRRLCDHWLRLSLAIDAILSAIAHFGALN